MMNWQKIKEMNIQDMMLLCQKADIKRGSEGRKLRKAVSWLLEEVY